MDIVIAGGSVSAFEAALAARKNAPESRIVIHSAENVLPYRRPALPGLICADEAEFAKMFIRKEDFYQDNRIEIELNSALCKLDTGKKTAEFSNGSCCTYDKFILATGGIPFVPPIPGADGSNVLTLRKLDDLLMLRQKINSGSCRSITIIGGGILGLEVADSLLKCGVCVNILEHSARLLQNNVSPEDSAFIMETLKQFENLHIFCNAAAGKITPEGVELTTGEHLAADLVILSTGSRPYLAGIPSNISVERGIIVNQFMQTSIPDVYACGDNCQFDGKVCGLYTTARAMAQVAGANAAGTETVYQPKLNSITLNTLGLKMSSDGKVTAK